ncbi:DNA repair protein RecN [Entomospira culicis]|uniref:DNA repair protein RecN n=1 Tax=Entomospira culicis TaxID=2719989 RepID=A0A968GDU9_9SPIO|nr:DNA repair protein RecN [Entomospira culicis]NIZ18502.1 DNA repair protein RecN [Entomospira culicis]NIZ68718.1 DNA repair protein RecN [Entomospira culicis]WDI37315.1 DNA repair protein RecN [Entomospira culicis]WDI38944.1 DNA repair protein RecN [Entomospira culicis]
MLQELRVKNYALLDQVSVIFEHGFTALTGETGAGKSLLVNALGLLLGEKSNTQFIRHGSEEAEVIGVVRLGDHPMVRALLSDLDIDVGDDCLELRRVVRVKGNSSIYANGARITREQLQEISALLFDMHGQHEHQSLYNQENQRLLLDRVAKIQEDVQLFSQQFTLLRTKKEQLKLMREQAETDLADRIYREKAYEEIGELKPSQEEKDELLARANQLENRERIQQTLQRFHAMMRGNSGLILGLKEARHLLKHLEDSESRELEKRLEGAILEVEDVSDSFSLLQDTLMGSPDELDRVQAKLMEYQRLEKKYGSGHLAGLLKYYQDIEIELGEQNNAEHLQVELESEIEALEQELRQKTLVITQQRESSARYLEEEMEKLLGEVSLPHARLVVSVAPRKNRAGDRVIGSTGADEVAFLFSANAGEPLKPLKEVASGGESSRILLILKSVLASQEEVDCLIFDEIDTGIGGEVAVQVAKHMRRLAQKKQVICITHLASIAAAAQSQLKIEKEVVDDHTRTNIHTMTHEQRVEEIARMLSGNTGDHALEHARSLLNSHDG